MTQSLSKCGIKVLLQKWTEKRRVDTFVDRYRKKDSDGVNRTTERDDNNNKK